MKALKIRVTKDDIKQGKRQDLGYCPIALGLRRTIEQQGGDVNIHSVKVDDDECKVTYTVMRTFPTPAHAQKFINRFDNGDSVKPSEFTLRG